MIRVLYNTIESGGADETTKVRGKCSAARMKVRIEGTGEETKEISYTSTDEFVLMM
jgi:hypothetical protein